MKNNEAFWPNDFSADIVFEAELWSTQILKYVPTSLPMTFEQFQQSLADTQPPATLNLALAGLWWDAKGDWNRAHESAQQDEGPEGSWVHAYLHRKEGDSGNAAYWYRRAGKAVCRQSLDEEWRSMVENLLN